MFGLFKTTTPKQKLQAEYRKLMEKAFKLSHSDRKASDRIVAQAEELMKRMEQM